MVGLLLVVLSINKHWFGDYTQSFFFQWTVRLIHVGVMVVVRMDNPTVHAKTTGKAMIVL